MPDECGEDIEGESYEDCNGDKYCCRECMEQAEDDDGCFMEKYI